MKKIYEKGFTAVEFILYMGILIILLTLLISIFVSILDTETLTDATGGIDQNARFILSRLTNDVHSASSITTPAAIGTQSGNLQLVINTINYSYTTDVNGNLTITNNNGTDNLNGYDASISAVSFRRLGNIGGKNSIQFNFNVTSRSIVRGIPEVRTYQTTVGLR